MSTIRLLFDSYRPPVRIRTGVHYLLWLSVGHRVQVQVSLVRHWMRWHWYRGPYRWRLQFAWLTVMVNRS